MKQITAISVHNLASTQNKAPPTRKNKINSNATPIIWKTEYAYILEIDLEFATLNAIDLITPTQKCSSFPRPSKNYYVSNQPLLNQSFNDFYRRIDFIQNYDVFTLTEAETETDKNGLHGIVWGCSY